jgi:hypothetical protein
MGKLVMSVKTTGTTTNGTRPDGKKHGLTIEHGALAHHRSLHRRRSLPHVRQLVDLLVLCRFITTIEPPDELRHRTGHGMPE